MNWDKLKKNSLAIQNVYLTKWTENLSFLEMQNMATMFQPIAKASAEFTD